MATRAGDPRRLACLPAPYLASLSIMCDFVEIIVFERGNRSFA
jgi:hypothetical protein